ncbi:hypothetical protein NA57DRAFT_59118 [Rhizodiscina lignyota]|uniref:DUF6594 domain-containing protein n=1 Tax=Rhizodiscina lignyota TaxID=1504668 RepID=A0A9P4IB84_9PEZI|nr:hypothetical protein NA57DRAFT_59118 [Rhizodiscina lignyota]
MSEHCAGLPAYSGATEPISTAPVPPSRSHLKTEKDVGTQDDFVRDYIRGHERRIRDWPGDSISDFAELHCLLLKDRLIRQVRALDETTTKPVDRVEQIAAEFERYSMCHASEALTEGRILTFVTVGALQHRDTLKASNFSVHRNFEEVGRSIALRQQKRKALMRRLALALLGGIAPIIPMMIMSLVSTKACSLATTSVATFLIACLVAIFSEAKEQEVLAVVAAYSAVLVVFVGTSNHGTG